MSGRCAPQSAYRPMIGDLPVKFGDKTLWYGLIAFYGFGAINVLSILATKLL